MPAVPVVPVRSNTALETTRLTVASARVPAAFDGFRVAHVSDLHNAEFGLGNADLLDLLRAAEPDLVAVTGARIAVLGADDPSMRSATDGSADDVPTEADAMREQLEGLTAQALSLVGAAEAGKSPFTLLLSHRPELFDVYAEAGVDLALAGHAHGGQFRLPFVGGVLAPNQGFFPQYDAGLYTDAGDAHPTAMVVSRGLGNSLFPFRVNNRPELVLVELHRAEG